MFEKMTRVCACTQTSRRKHVVAFASLHRYYRHHPTMSHLLVSVSERVAWADGTSGKHL